MLISLGSFLKKIHIHFKVVPAESSNSGTKQCDNNNNNNSFKQKIKEKVSKVVTKCQSPSSTLDYNNSLGVFNGISYPTDIVLKDKFTDNIEPVLPKFLYSKPIKEGFICYTFTRKLELLCCSSQ